MRKYRLLISLFIFALPFNAFAAIAFDNAVSCTPASSASTISCSFTVGSGANRAIIIGIWADDNTGIIGSLTGATYNSVKAGSLATSTTANNHEAVYLWCLLAPASGANTLAASFSGMSAGDTFNVMATSYSGVDQTTACSSLPTATNNTNAGSSPTVALTGSGSSPWLVGIASNGSGAVTASTNTTSRAHDVDGRDLADSNGVVSPTALNWTSVSGSYAVAAVNLTTASASAAASGPFFLAFWW
jgi:hypothetical protein